MDCRVFPAHINVHLQRVLLQECHIEAIDLVDERELGLVVGLGSFCHLGRLRAVIVEVNRNHCKQRLVVVIFLGNFWDLVEVVQVEFCIFDFDIENILVLVDLRFL